MSNKFDRFMNRFLRWFILLTVIFAIITFLMKVKYGWGVGTWLLRLGLGVLFSAAWGLFASLSGTSASGMSNSVNPFPTPPGVRKDSLKQIPVSKLTDMLKDPNPKTRRNVVSELANRPDPLATTLMRNTLKDPDDFVRIISAKALSKTGDASLIPEIEEARDMSHKDNRIHFQSILTVLRQQRE